MDFSFARIFSTGKDLLEEMPDESDAAQDEADSWAQILAQLAQLEAATNTRTVESSGRGAKRKAAQKKVRRGLECMFFTNQCNPDIVL